MSTSKLRVASVGKDFRDKRVESITFQSKQTLLDRDVVLLKLNNVQYSYNPSINGTYQGARSVGEYDSPRFEADVARRRREIKALLERGGTVVLFLPAPDHWYFDTGQRQYSGTGKNRQTTSLVSRRDLYSIVPLKIEAEAAESRDFEVIGGEPFAAFWRAIDGDMQCAAYMTTPFGRPVLKIRGTDLTVASIGKGASGTVIILPQDILYYYDDDDDDDDDDDAAADADADADDDDGDDADDDDDGVAKADAEVEAAYPEDVRFLDALFELIRELRSEVGDYSLPEWTSGFRLPGEAEQAGAVADAERKMEEALAQVDVAKADLSRLERRKLLLTGTGAAFETVVGEAFEALGCSVEEGQPGRTDRLLRHPTLGVAVVEAKGKGKSGAERDAAQLEKWVAEHQLAHEERAKGILVINAWRVLPLDERTEAAFPEQMIGYSAARGALPHHRATAALCVARRRGQS